MPYRQTPFVQGNFYHIYARGNEKRKIFLRTGDYQRFLARLETYSLQANVKVLAFCLMPNHFHLLLQQGETSLGKLLQRLETAYAMYFNRRYDRVGHLFQGVFGAKIVTEDQYLLHLTCYIHRNAGEILDGQSLDSYPWSSYAEYLGIRQTWLFVDPSLVLSMISEVGSASFIYRALTETPSDTRPGLISEDFSSR